MPPYSILGATIALGDKVLFGSILAAGATFVGTKLETINSLRAAM
jgi:hypothetical protein